MTNTSRIDDPDRSMLAASSPISLSLSLCGSNAIPPTFPEHPILIPINISINILIDIESIENIEYFNIFVIDYFFKNIDLIIDLVIDLVIEF